MPTRRPSPGLLRRPFLSRLVRGGRRPLRAGLLLCLALSAAACRTGRPDYTVNVPPNLVDVRPPRSVLFVQAPVRLDALERALDRAVPGGGQGRLAGGLGGIELRWQLRRQAVSIAPGPQGLELRIPLLGELSIGAGFLRCQAPGIGGVVRIAAQPALDTDGTLLLRSAQVAIDPQGSVQCAGIAVPVASIFPLILGPVQQAVSGMVGALRLPLGPLAQQGLAELAKPRALSLGGRPACLDLAPGSLILAPVRAGAASEALIRVGVDVAPRVNLGACPAASPPPTAVVARDADLGDEYRVAVAVAIPADDLARQLSPALVGRRFGSGDMSVTVDQVEVGDASGRALIRLGVHGAFDGALYLWGTPQIGTDGARSLLSVPDLRIAAESTSRVQQAKLDLYQLFAGDLAELVKPKLVLDVTQHLEGARRALSGRTQITPALAVDTTLSQVLPGPVESRPGVLVVHATLVGKTQLAGR